MHDYALMILRGANRVYTQASADLTRSELEVCGRRALGGGLRHIAPTLIGGVPYVTFSADGLNDRDVGFLANLSSVAALFEREGDLLRPVTLQPLDRFDDDLITIQRYVGKTNELFTKLLLNVTLFTSSFAGEMLDRKFAVLDPLCGRGTTLNQALMYGFDAAGIDVDTRDFEAYSVFIRTWLKSKRLKHHAESGPVRRDRRLVARRLDITLGATKEDYRAGATQRLTVCNADTTQGLELLKAGSFDVVVTDMPYGVQHGSHAAGERLSRAPAELLSRALPVWTGLLRSGGALGVAWNTRSARREEVAAMVAGHGLTVQDSPPYLSFQHRVDQAITRDILVAHKP